TPVDRKIHEHTGLYADLNFLFQLDLARQSNGAVITRMFHRLLSHRIGKHVVTESALIARIERLQINNRTVNITIALGPDPIFRESFAAYLLCVLLQFFGPDKPGKTDALHAPDNLIGTDMLNETEPLASIHNLGGIEQGGATA